MAPLERAIRTRILNALTILCCILILVGAIILIWLWAAPQYSAWQAETQFDDILRSSATQVAVDPEKKDRELKEAQAYNDALAGRNQMGISVEEYMKQLDWPNGDAMSWLEIPAIDVKLPVYHTDSDEILMQGLGHLQESSLPVGGDSSHCLVTGHSGMANTRMFDDLRSLKVGDTFVFWTLGDPYAYRVYDIEVVNPDDVSSLYIQKGRDLATLITCTPYGINSHRLLVHAERCDYDAEAITAESAPASSDRLIYLILGLIALLFIPFFILYLILGMRQWRLIFVDEDGAEDGEHFWSRSRDGCGDYDEIAILGLSYFRRAWIEIDDLDRVKGSWKRAGKSEPDENGKRHRLYEIDFDGEGHEASKDPELMLEMAIPDGAFIAERDGERLYVDGLGVRLTFER